ncbi:cysteine protease [Striga asiatica]|uniref:Cysteine protease n=1 Tax=Striga asiatica TaxID=4170 RepID=A0A5A7RAQ5_STRAF|nr:cysteine protease [Striga asiatica]
MVISDFMWRNSPEKDRHCSLTDVNGRGRQLPIDFWNVMEFEGWGDGTPTIVGGLLDGVRLREKERARFLLHTVVAGKIRASDAPPQFLTLSTPFPHRRTSRRTMARALLLLAFGVLVACAAGAQGRSELLVDENPIRQVVDGLHELENSILRIVGSSRRAISPLS